MSYHRVTQSITRRKLMLATAGLAVGASELHAENYPSKPLRILVGFAPGGTSDLLARFLAKGLSEKLGQSVVVENKPGANGIIGTDAAARAPADGYTLLLGTADTHAINPSLYKNLPYDAEKDFTPISLIGRLSFFLIASKSTPFENAAEMIAYAKRHPEKLTYASWGNGSTGHLAMESLASTSGVKMRHIPYKGMGLAAQDLLSGQVDVMLAGPTLVPHLRSGALKLLGVSSSTRLRSFPQTRTIGEQIGRTFVADSWYALYGPTKLDPEILRRIHEATAEVMAGGSAVSLLESQSGLAIETGTPGELASLQQAEIGKWREIIQRANVKL